VTLNYDVYRRHYDVGLHRSCVQSVELNISEIVKMCLLVF